MQHTTHSPEETKLLAQEVASTLKGGEVLFLEGDLGSGKTTFVQGLVHAFGYTEPVRSPTFALMHTYHIDHPTVKQIVHLDLYRLNDPSELRAFGLEEVVHDPRTIVLIEWPEKGFDGDILLPDKRIVFTIGEHNQRTIAYGKT